MAILVALATAAASDVASAQSVVIAVPSQTLTFASHFIAQDGGFYAKEGLKVEERLLVGVASINAVLAGSADFTPGAGASLVRAVASGQKLLGIATPIDRPLVELVLRKDVADAAGITAKTPLDQRIKVLKGKTIAIQGVGSFIHATQRVVARRAGLDPDNDMRIAPMDPPAMLTALASKQIDGFTTSLPFTTQAVVSGDAIMLVSGPNGDLPDYLPIDYIVLQTRPEVCQKERIKCEKVGRAFKAAVDFITKSPDKALEVLKKRFANMDPKVLAAAWSVVSKAHAAGAKVTLKGLENSQKFSIDAGLLEPKDVLKDFAGIYTDEFVK